MNKLILVRHGQSQWNLEKRFTGWVDVELTKKGKLEAKLAGKLIKELDINFKVSFTSLQKRAINTLQIILEILNKKNIEICKSWKLNERHYGALTGLNKDDIRKKHGKKQIQIWRRSWNIPPPAASKNYIKKFLSNMNYSGISEDKIPNGESLRGTYERVIPFFEKKILPLLKNKKNIIISAHGNSLRTIFKRLFDISIKNIIKLEIPTGNPFLISFDKDMKIINYKYLDLKRSKKIIF